MDGASGHGSGYDGKLDPGLFVQQDPDTSCYLRDGTETRVKSMIKVHRTGEASYYDSCREENPKDVAEGELSFLYGSVVVYQGEAFNAEDEVPTTANPTPILLGACIFDQIEEPNFDGAVASAQISVFQDDNSNSVIVKTTITELERSELQTVNLPDRAASLYQNSPTSLQLSVGANPTELDIHTPDKGTGLTELSLLVEGRLDSVNTTDTNVCNFNAFTN